MLDLEGSGQVPNIPQQPTQQAQPTQQSAFDQGVQPYQQPQQFQYQAPQVQQPQQQPQQPVQQPVLQQQAQAPEVKQTQAPVQNYGGDDPLSVGVQIFTRSVGVDEAAFYDALAPALQYSDPNLINLQALTRDLTPEQQAQAKALADSMYQQAQQVKQQTIQTAYQKAGGEQQWRQAIDAFNAKAPQAFKAAAKAMEESGQINEAVDFILDMARQYGFVGSSQGQPLQGSFGSQGVRGLSQGDYRTELATLVKEVGATNVASHPKFKQLSDARALGMQQGL